SLHDALPIYSFWLKDFSVTFQKVGVSHPVLCPSVFDLRVREGNPDLINLIFLKETVQKFDLGAEECHIVHVLLCGLLGAKPKTGTFNIDSDEVLLRKCPG